MGCDIHVFGFDENHREIDIGELLDSRSYGVFGFLADVRNYSAVPPIAQRRGYPEWCKELRDPEHYYHSASWLSLDELRGFDYGKTFEDRRCTIDNDGGCTCEPGQGKVVTFREFLGDWFFDDVEQLWNMGVRTIVFDFDS